jgi:GntR family transcriptional regulator
MGTQATIWQQLQPDASQPTPLYLQLAQRLEAALLAGHWQSDQALPAERVISQQLKVSRVTARNALEVLIRKGVVNNRHGSGNYVTAHKPQPNPLAPTQPAIAQPAAQDTRQPTPAIVPAPGLLSFAQDIAARGYTHSAQWISQDTAPATQDEILRLALSPGAVVIRCKILHSANGVAMALEQTSFASHHAPPPLQGSVQTHLHTHGIHIHRALQHIQAVSASQDIAQSLAVPQGSALLQLTSVAYTASGQPITLTQRTCRSDYYSLVIELRN